MKKNNKKNLKLTTLGFTLIELLAVIVILAVIALISVPIILNLIEKARMSAFSDTAYGLIESAKLTYTENLIDGKSEVKTYVYPFESLKFSGTKPNGGMIRIDHEGNAEIAIHNNKWCALKTKENSKVEIIKYEEDTCKLEDVESPNQKLKTFKEVMESTPEEVASLDPDHNLRYVGKDPNNYVKFNNELWRIIGVFDNQAKIIRDEPYSTSIAWDKSASNGGHGDYGYNDWSTSTLQVELNTTFLDSVDTTSKEQIDQNYVWKLGGWNTPEITRDVMYQKERGTTVYTGRPKTWIGAIGLMYPSDYAYATSSTEEYCNTTNLYVWDNSSYADCRNKDWLYNSSKSQWTLMSNSVFAYNVFSVGSSGSVYRWGDANDTNAARPVLYLKSDVKIQAGDGTKEKPFEIS